MRRLLLLAAAVAVLGAGGASRAAAAPACGRAAARAAILASPALRPLRPYLRVGDGGVDRVICRDLTGDGAAELAATIFSGGTAGDIAWVLFRAVRGRWELAYRALDRYKLGLVRRGADLVETTPVYRRNDPNCCPTGGFDHRRVRWTGSRFAVVRRWHDGRASP